MCVPPVELLSHSIDRHEIWHPHYVVWGHPSLLPSAGFRSFCPFLRMHDSITAWRVFIKFGIRGICEELLNCLNLTLKSGPLHGLSDSSSASRCGGMSSILGQSVWGWWRKKWHWARYFSPSAPVFPCHCHSTVHPFIIVAVNSVVKQHTSQRRTVRTESSHERIYGFRTSACLPSRSVWHNVQSNWVITSSKGPNKLCRYKRVSLYARRLVEVKEKCFETKYRPAGMLRLWWAWNLYCS